MRKRPIYFFSVIFLSLLGTSLFMKLFFPTDPLWLDLLVYLGFAISITAIEVLISTKLRQYLFPDHD